MCYRAQVARVSLRRKHFVRNVRQQIKDAAVGIVNEDDFGLCTVGHIYSSRGLSPSLLRGGRFRRQ